MLTLFAVSGVCIFSSALIMALVLLVRGRSWEQFLWGIFCLLVVFWGIGAYGVGTSTSATDSLFWWRVGYLGVIFIPALFTHFVYVFLHRPQRVLICTLYGIALFHFLANVFTEVFIGGVHQMFGSLYYLSPSLLYNSYMLLWVLLIPYTHVLLYREFRRATEERKRQLEYFFLGSFVGFLGGSTSFFAVYGLDIYPYGNFAVALYPIVMGYAVLKYRLWDFRVFVTQACIIALWVFLLVQSILAPLGSTEQFLDIALLALTVLVGYLLVRSVNREIQLREEIEHLSTEKSEFMTFASHEIRNPITAMRGYASLITDGTTGQISSETKDAAEKILVTGNEVLSLIGQFLNKSKMELGQISYSMDPFDIGAAVAAVADGYAPHAHQKGLEMRKELPATALMVKADQGKVKEVVGNIIDNSLKYTRTGGITVSVQQTGGKVRVTIADTGVGIPADTLPQLFKKFSRADAQKANLLGTGVGLYLAKTFIEGMGGKIWAESDGKDKGSRFIIEFPQMA